VPRELLAHCPGDARIVDTAPLTLDEIEAEFVKSHLAGFGRWRGCIRVTFPFTAPLPSNCGDSIGTAFRTRSLPGVPAFAAAAATLGCELTVPEVAQSVVLTRMPGPRFRDAQGRAARELRRHRGDASRSISRLHRSTAS